MNDEEDENNRGNVSISKKKELKLFHSAFLNPKAGKLKNIEQEIFIQQKFESKARLSLSVEVPVENENVFHDFIANDPLKRKNKFAII